MNDLNALADKAHDFLHAAHGMKDFFHQQSIKFVSWAKAAGYTEAEAMAAMKVHEGKPLNPEISRVHVAPTPQAMRSGPREMVASKDIRELTEHAAGRAGPLAFKTLTERAAANKS
jgi:hypothetical protein